MAPEAAGQAVVALAAGGDLHLEQENIIRAAAILDLLIHLICHGGQPALDSSPLVVGAEQDLPALAGRQILEELAIFAQVNRYPVLLGRSAAISSAFRR